MKQRARTRGPARRLTLVGAIAICGALSAAVGTSTAGAQTSSPSSCSGVTLTPAGPARPGGQVLLTGQVCDGAAAYAAGGSSSVRINLLKGKRWTPVARASIDRSGKFSTCTKVRLRRGTRTARIKASAADGSTAYVRVRLSSSARKGCLSDGSGTTTPPPTTDPPATDPPTDPTPTPTEPPPPPPPTTDACPLSQATSALGIALPTSCNVVRADTAGVSDAHDLWGGDAYACAAESRVSRPTSGGDPGATAVGAAQGDSAFRETTVLDGDNYSGERCELAYNTWHSPFASATNPYGTFYNYHEGERRATYASLRLPASFPLSAQDWQNVLQIKQSGPSDGSSGTPILSIKAYKGQWQLFHTPTNSEGPDTPIWQTPAQKGVWTRFAIDGYFSQDPSLGWIKLYVDSNGDHDFADSGEQSPVFHTNTLKRELSGVNTDGMTQGSSIPSHLRVGIYHNSSIPCPAPTGCSVDVDNVQVVAP
jgi:hypothetical protein